jgi:uncharacterized protein with HEPN domain
MRDPTERLRDILDAIAAIDRYRDREKAAFEEDELLQVRFLRHLQIIGEAAWALPEDVRALAPEVPWTDIIGMRIIGMRNVPVHGYFAIDADIVWDAATATSAGPEACGRVTPQDARGTRALMAARANPKGQGLWGIDP